MWVSVPNPIFINVNNNNIKYFLYMKMQWILSGILFLKQFTSNKNMLLFLCFFSAKSKCRECQSNTYEY